MRRSHVRLRMAVTLLAIFAVTPPPASGEDRVFRIYDHQHGLPTDEVSDVTQDAAAFLWIATPGGLVRFDGSEMRRWDTGGRRVTRLAAADGFGVVAIDEAARLFRINPSGGLDDLPGPDGEPLDDVLDVATDASRGLWVLRTGELLHARDVNAWSRFPRRRFGGERLRSVRPDRDSGAFVITADAIWLATVSGEVRRAAEVRHAVDVLREPDGDMLVLASAVLAVKPTGDMQPLLELATARPVDLVTREGTTWVAFDRFVVRLRPGTPPAFIGPEHGLPSGGRLFVDREGSLWICSFRGLLQYPEPETVIWSERDGLPSTHARFLGQNAEGIWVSTWGGLVRVDTAAGEPRVIPVGPRHSGEVCIDGAGGLWFGGASLYERAGGVTTVHEYPDASIRFCAPGRDGSVWLGVSGRLLNASRGRTRAIAAPPGHDPALAYPAPLLEDRHGWLWIADSTRICRARVAALKAAGAWLCEALPEGVEPSALIETHDGLWLATQSHGVLRRGDETWQAIPASLELGGGRVFNLRQGRDRTIWVLGLGRPTRVRDRPDTDAGWEVIQVLSAWHGVPSGGISDLLEAPDGTIWAAGAAGVVRVPEHARRDPPAPPRVQLSGVMLDGRAVPPEEPLSLTHGRNLLELRFAALTYRDRALLRYQARIGTREHWTDLTAGDPVLAFAELSSGSYVAEFRASLDRRRWSGQPSRLAFRVNDPWYLQPWFFALAAGAVGVLLVLAHRARLRLALRLERQRTQIAMDLHDEIGSGLGSIGILAGIASSRTPDRTTRSLLGDIGDAAGELSTSLGDIVWSLRPGSRTLQELVERIAERGHRLFPDEHPAFICSIPEMTEPVILELAVQRNVLLIVAEALHNAAVHAGARRVEVLITAEAGRWRIRVQDDGRGFDPVASSTPKGGLGLRSMRRRAEEIGAALQVHSTRAAGTSVSLLFHPAGRRASGPAALA